MDITTEKERIKSEIDAVTDERLIRAIKEMLSYAKANNKERYLRPFTKKQLVKRALASEQDIKNGKTTSLKDLRKQVKSW
jgi:hypothetical protein